MVWQDDPRLEAKADAHMEWLKMWGWRCRLCDTLWDPEIHTEPGRASTVDRPACPLCGGPPVEA